MELVAALKGYQAEIAYEAQEERLAARQREIDSINDVINEMWAIIEERPGVYDKEGREIGIDHDQIIKAANTILKGIEKRSALQGLSEVDVAQAKTAVFIVRGEEKDYIEQLQETIPDLDPKMKQLPPQSTSDSDAD